MMTLSETGTSGCYLLCLQEGLQHCMTTRDHRHFFCQESLLLLTVLWVSDLGHPLSLTPNYFTVLGGEAVGKESEINI